MRRRSSTPWRCSRTGLTSSISGANPPGRESMSRWAFREEIDRVVPVMEGVLRYRPESILSIDTYKSATAAAALHAGAEIVNDVSGFLWDQAMAAVCAAARCGVVLMHTRGRPEDWHALPGWTEQVVPQVKQELQREAAAALGAGIERERIVLDPGFGFGKVFDQNYSLLAGLAELSTLGQPLLAGVSRKSISGQNAGSLYRRGGCPVIARECVSGGGHRGDPGGGELVRVHDVRSTREAAAIADAVLAAAAA